MITKDIIDMRPTRRELFAGSAAAVLFASPQRSHAQSTKRLTATTRVLEVNGKSAKVFALLGPDGEPGITLQPGERFAITLDNQAKTPTIVHWHGQLPDWKQVGFPWPEVPGIAAGSNRLYDFEPIAGTFWMHSHEGMQEQQLMAAPLIVHDKASASANMQEVVMTLHDFSFKSPGELLAGLTADGGTMGKIGSGGGIGSMSMGSGMSGAADLNDVEFDAFLANERTLADPSVVRAATGQAIRLRIINGSSSTNYWVDLGELSGKLIAVDGHVVNPLMAAIFPIAMAQRLDIVVRLAGAGAYPVLAQVEGKTDRTGIILATAGAKIPKLTSSAYQATPAVDLSLETRLTTMAPISGRQPDKIIPLRLDGDMSHYVWSLNGKTWPNPDVMMVQQGQLVAIDMTNPSMMSHPMHLHGHAFQVVSINGRPINGAIRDTVLVPPMGTVRIAFTADNPGRWALHCHNLYHMMGGMMTEVRYPGIV